MKLLILVTLTIILTSLFPAGGDAKPKKVEVFGFVVARDVLLPYGGGYHNSSSEAFIVRVDTPKGLAEQTRYIKVYYHRWLDEPYLPSDFFESSRKWRLKVSRSPDCDGTMKGMATVINANTGEPFYSEWALPELLPNAESEQIPADRTLPCYVLKPSDLKSLKKVE